MLKQFAQAVCSSSLLKHFAHGSSKAHNGSRIHGGSSFAKVHRCMSGRGEQPLVHDDCVAMSKRGGVVYGTPYLELYDWRSTSQYPTVFLEHQARARTSSAKLALLFLPAVNAFDSFTFHWFDDHSSFVSYLYHSSFVSCGSVCRLEKKCYMRLSIVSYYIQVCYAHSCCICPSAMYAHKNTYCCLCTRKLAQVRCA